MYMSELSEFRNFQLQADGRFRDDRLRTYLAYEEHWPFLINSRNEAVGFALVRKSKPATYAIGELFIHAEHRRSGLGRQAVAEILQKFPGNWELSFQNENFKAALFWRRIVQELGYQVTETNLPVSGQPYLPHDVWLSFSYLANESA